MSSVPSEMLPQIVDEHTAAPHGSKQAVIQEWADFLGVSAMTVRRGIAPHLPESCARKARNDKGQNTLTEEEIKSVLKIKAVSKRANGKWLLSSEQALKIAWNNELIPRLISASRFNRLVREMGLDNKTLERQSAHVSLSSPHPNHTWQFDVSTSVLYYLEGKGKRKGKFHRLLDSEDYKNKPDNVVEKKDSRLQRYLITDHCSSSIFCRYYRAPAEDPKHLFAFLMEAFAKKPGFVMHGVPFHLLWDKGTANRSTPIKHVLDALGVKRFEHEAGNPRAKGQSEVYHNIVEKQFEGTLALTNIDDVDHLNQLVDDWQIEFNATKIFKRHGHTRWGHWQTVDKEQLRLAAPIEFCQAQFNGPAHSRKVSGGYRISYASRFRQSTEFDVRDLPDIYVGATVLVRENYYHLPNAQVAVLPPGQVPDIKKLDLEKLTWYECAPIEFDQNGFRIDAQTIGDGYSSRPDSHVDEFKKEMYRDAYGVSKEREAQKLKARGGAAFGGSIDPFVRRDPPLIPEFMERPGTPIAVRDTSRYVPKPLHPTDLARKVRPLLGRNLTIAENEAIKRWYPDGAPEEVVNEIATRLQAESPQSGPAIARGGE